MSSENKMPETKIEAVRFLAAREQAGLKIDNPEGINWRLLSLTDLISLAQDLWRMKHGK